MVNKEIGEIKKLIAKNGYEIIVINTFTGVNWDNPASKNFALLVGKKQLNPIYLKNLGWDTHYNKISADRGLFYSGVLGSSRAFEIVYNLSSWLFKDGYKIKQI
ncbi:MAG: hypothetical protein AABY22_08540 [Nanoarchaeota archaeon]